jgi:hypothetical protein
MVVSNYLLHCAPSQNGLLVQSVLSSAGQHPTIHVKMDPRFGGDHGLLE